MDPQVPPIIPPQIPTRKVAYKLDRQDVFGCRLWVMAHNRFILGFSVICAIFVAGSLVVNPAMANGSLGLKIFTLVTGFVGFFIFLIVVQLAVQIVFILVRKNQGVVGAHELEICDDGLRQRTDVSESLHRWQGFHKIVSRPGFIFVYTTENNIEYIPRRAFASQQQSKEFEEELIARFKNAKNRR